MEIKKTALISRNITLNKRRTSIRLEAQMWVALKEIATREKCTIHDICGVIALRKSDNITLTAAIRIFLMLYFKAAATDEGHHRAGHGGFQRMMSRVANQQSVDTYAHGNKSVLHSMKA
jgi:predicted DNA-binding ribbon-helix-helix protein